MQGAFMVLKVLNFFHLGLLNLTVLSLFLSALIVALAKRTDICLGRRQDLKAIQTMHERPTPRIGGIAIFSALALSTLLAPPAVSEPYRDLIMAAAILFCVGLLEDIGISISPRNRLVACVLASLTLALILGDWLPRLGIPGVDVYMGHWYVGLPLTLLITAGVANGFNLIDGINGLASITAIAAAVSLALIARQAGYQGMVPLTLMLCAAVFGFLMLNFPFGMIFLGDAGAYTIGYVLAWFGIFVLLNSPEVSPWAILLTILWPLADTLLAIFRRMRRQQSSMAPDRLHMHQLVMRALEIYAFGRGRRRLTNPISTAVLTPFVVAPPLVGTLVWDKNLLAFASTIIFLILFLASYAGAFRVLPHLTRKRGAP